MRDWVHAMKAGSILRTLASIRPRNPSLEGSRMRTREHTLGFLATVRTATHLKMIRTSLLFTELLVLVAGVFNGRAENGVTSSGILRETMLNGNKVVRAESSTNEFSATITSSGKYFIEMRPIHRKGDPLYGKTDIMYLTFDGTDTYYCQYSEAIIDITNGRPAFVGTKSISDRRQWSYISAGNYPFSSFDSQSRTHILWLVYGSGQYIHDQTPQSIPLPWVPARYSLLSYGFRLHSMLSYEPPYIPTSLEFIRDSRLDLQDEKGERERPELDLPDDRAALVEWQSELQVRKIRWHDGAVAGQLKTGAFTNANVFNVPLEFTFNTFLPSGKSRRTYEATITNIATKQIHSGFSTNAFLPPVLSKLAVQDTRFRFRDQATNVNNIYYRSTRSRVGDFRLVLC